MDLFNLDLDMEDVNISLEDLQNIDLLEASYLSEIRIALIENQSQSNLDIEYEIHNPTKWRNRRRRVIASYSESETDSVTNFITENVASMKEPYARKLKHAEGDYFKLMVADDLFEKIAAETNLFAEQYHSKDRVFGQSFAPSVMSRNRFELILRMLHFTNNQAADKFDRIFKIRSILDALNENFAKYYSPKEEVCIDESQVLFRCRIIFGQYNKSKRHKYGMKLFKLCTIPGYTCKLDLYADKNHVTVNTTPTRVVMSLCDDILNLGHTVATDNWYTSIDLANELLNKDKHLVGTLRKNRRGLPKNVVDAKLKPGELIAMENERGISYNKAKGAVDLSDQMTSYSSPLRKTVKWYKKLGMELILNTALVNAWVRTILEDCSTAPHRSHTIEKCILRLTNSFLKPVCSEVTGALRGGLIQDRVRSPVTYVAENVLTTTKGHLKDIRHHYLLEIITHHHHRLQFHLHTVEHGIKKNL
ncbi:PiggyBac transposable element-derived protein 4 [Eumeta japonica]|uniref:PiggyBac transposable element-derived protein 4 n=1 Tax=Eumeta variegata TaxID=151549 RepID=A0A4C1TDT6_EUMVA|nr:PiggyBac transposable element-derived protein 4 [Eumeta japonica]